MGDGYLADSAVTPAYRGTLFNLTGKTNNAASHHRQEARGRVHREGLRGRRLCPSTGSPRSEASGSKTGLRGAGDRDMIPGPDSATDCGKALNLSGPERTIHRT